MATDNIYTPVDKRLQERIEEDIQSFHYTLRRMRQRCCRWRRRRCIVRHKQDVRPGKFRYN